MKKVSTVGMSRKEWLDTRRNTIGGSEAAAIVGLSGYETPYTIWANKTGRIPDAEDNEAMRQGRDLEEYVAQRWEEATGKKARRVNAILYNPDYPFSHADIDRSVVGENAGLECKTTSTLNIKQFHGVDLPEKYYVQCVHYLAVTGYDRWYLAVLVFEKGFYTFVLERNQAEIDALMAAEQDFWAYVVSDNPPPVDGMEPTTEVLDLIYDADPELPPADLAPVSEEIRRYLTLKEQIRELKQQADAAGNEIKEYMAGATKGAYGDFAVSWKPVVTSRFSKAAFMKDHPDIDLSPYHTQSHSRRFEIKETAS